MDLHLAGNQGVDGIQPFVHLNTLLFIIIQLNYLVARNYLHQESSMISADGEGVGHLEHGLLVLGIFDSRVGQVDYSPDNLEPLLYLFLIR